MVARIGYKLTEVGEIPEDWEIVQLDDIAKVTSGKRLPSGFSVTKYETPHPYIRVSDMQPGNVSTENIMYVPINAAEHIKQYRIYKGDLFISVAGTLGIVGKIPPELNGANLTENADRITEIRCDKSFLLYILLSPHTQSVIDSIRTVGAQPKLALGRIRKFDIPLPPTEKEQIAIATALSDADALIEALEQSIAKKRHIKQGAMQELLTGKRRLPGFAGEWHILKISDIGTLKGGSTFPVSYQGGSSGEYPFFKVSDMNSVENSTVMRQAKNYISESERRSISAILFPEKSIVFAKIGAAIFLERKHILMQSSCIDNNMTAIILDNTKADYKFFYQYLQNIKLGQFVSTTALPSLSNTVLSVIEMKLPPTLEEQTAIAAVLSDMDDEITALEAKLAKARQIKIGMMQELLTGRIRLV